MKSYAALEAELHEARARLEQAQSTIEYYHKTISELTDKLTDARAEAKFERAKAERWEEFAGEIVKGRRTA